MVSSFTWIAEVDVFPSRYQKLREAIVARGHEFLEWCDGWWSNQRFPTPSTTAVVFHGSLGNADRVARELSWRPGSLCETSSFTCSAYYESFRGSLLHTEYLVTTVERLVEDPIEVAGSLARGGRVFVRPDSPLKPFSGRVVELEGLTLGHLDHGFYYDGPRLPVIVSPVQEIVEEWRFVVIAGQCEPDRVTRPMAVLQ